LQDIATRMGFETAEDVWKCHFQLTTGRRLDYASYLGVHKSVVKRFCNLSFMHV
jgi:hypothetical protein